MDGANSKTGEVESPPFLSITVDSNIERPKVVDAGVREGRRILSKSFIR